LAEMIHLCHACACHEMALRMEAVRQEARKLSELVAMLRERGAPAGVLGACLDFDGASPARACAEQLRHFDRRGVWMAAAELGRTIGGGGHGDGGDGGDGERHGEELRRSPAGGSERRRPEEEEAAEAAEAQQQQQRRQRQQPDNNEMVGAPDGETEEEEEEEELSQDGGAGCADGADGEVDATRAPATTKARLTQAAADAVWLRLRLEGGMRDRSPAQTVQRLLRPLWRPF
jgi:hypothetical protein